MVIIQDILISDAIFTEQFICNLTACKGACCVEGDYGAPLEKEELPLLDQAAEATKPYLRPESVAALDKKGAYTYADDIQEWGTALLNGKECVFTIFENGIAKCGIEKAWLEGKTEFRKPISCYLYPIRVIKRTGFEAINYDEWDICSAACQLGKEKKVAVYEFLKEPLIAKYGKDFYEELAAYGEHLKQQKK